MKFLCTVKGPEDGEGGEGAADDKETLARFSSTTPNGWNPIKRRQQNTPADLALADATAVIKRLTDIQTVLEKTKKKLIDANLKASTSFAKGKKNTDSVGNAKDEKARSAGVIENADRIINSANKILNKLDLFLTETEMVVRDTGKFTVKKTQLFNTIQATVAARGALIDQQKITNELKLTPVSVRPRTFFGSMSGGSNISRKNNVCLIFPRLIVHHQYGGVMGFGHGVCSPFATSGCYSASNF